MPALVTRPEVLIVIVVAIALASVTWLRKVMRRRAPATTARLKAIESLADQGLNLLSILGAGVAVLANAFNPALDIAIPAIFSLLAVLLYDQMTRERRYSQPILESVQRLVADREAFRCLDDACVDQIPFERELEQARRCDILANTMVRTLTSHSAAFGTFLKRGGRLRVITMNHGGDQAAIKMAAARVHTTVETFLAKIRLTLDQLEAMRPPQRGKLEIKLCDIAPSFGLYAFNRGCPDARIYLRIFAHYIELDRNPTLKVTQRGDPKLFQMLDEQFELVWRHSKAHEARPLPSPPKVAT